MVKKNFKVLVLGAALCVGLGGYSVSTVFANANEVVTKSATEVAWQMSYGASVRVPTDGANIGIRYTAQMSKADYEALKAYGYQDLSYGVLIAPADYVSVKPLNAANVFGVGGEKVYDWANWNAETSEWEYSGSLTRIINLEAYNLTENVTDANVVEYKGSIINLEEVNKTRAFVGVGYIKYSMDGETYAYEFADYNGGDIANNTRSMAQVVTKAIEDTSADNPLTAEQKTALKNSYHTGVDYVVRTYKETANGTYQETTEENATAISAWKTANPATVGETLDVTALATSLQDSDYYFDTWNNDVVTENAITETGRAYFDLYYSEQVDTDYTFENMGYVPNTFVAKNTSANMFSIATVTGMNGEQTKAFKLSNANQNTYSSLAINLGTEFFANATQNSVLKFKVYIDSNESDIGWFFFKVTPEETATAWLYQDNRNINKNAWLEYCIPYADLTKEIGSVRMVDSGWLHLYPEAQKGSSAITNRNFNMYVDDIELVEANNYDFDNVTFVPSSITTTYHAEKTTMSVDNVTVGGKTSKALKIVSTGTPYTQIDFGTAYFADVTANQALKVKLAYKNTGFVAVNTFVKINTGATWYYDNQAADALKETEWTEFVITGNGIEELKTNGKMLLLFSLNGQSAYGYELYIEEISIVDYQEDYTFAQFDKNVMNNITVAHSSFGNDNLALTGNPIASGSAVLVHSNTARGGASYLNLAFFDLNALSAGDTISFKIYSDWGSTTQYPLLDDKVLQVILADTAFGRYGAHVLNKTNCSAWYTCEYTLTAEQVAKIQSEGAVWLGLDIFGGKKGYAVNFYLDDFQVIKA